MTRPAFRISAIALALVGSIGSHGANPSVHHRTPASRPAAAVAVGSPHGDARWSHDPRSMPGQSELPIHYLHIQRATEPEEESPGSGPELALLHHLSLDPGLLLCTSFRAFSQLSLDGCPHCAQAILRC
jgi:hypothetical protein